MTKCCYKHMYMVVALNIMLVNWTDFFLNEHKCTHLSASRTPTKCELICKLVFLYCWLFVKVDFFVWKSTISDTKLSISVCNLQQ